MFKRNLTEQIGRSISVAFVCAVVALMSVAAFASKGLVQDRRVSLAQAKQMAQKIEGEFPVMINDLVLEQLNRYIGTPEGREFMKQALFRMKTHQAVIENYMEKYSMPEELLAIPLIESGYQNLEQGQNPGYPSWKAAGLWQFIVSTARNYGLIVSGDVDERLNVPLATDAAMRLLQADKLRFKDWLLAVMAYNMGEAGLQKGINATGSRDAWTLIRKGYEGDKNYLAKFMAGILIIRNPESVQ